MTSLLELLLTLCRPLAHSGSDEVVTSQIRHSSTMSTRAFPKTAATLNPTLNHAQMKVQLNTHRKSGCVL